MEGRPQNIKRPRLDSWAEDSSPTSANRQLSDASPQGYPHSSFPPQAQFANQQPTMGVWDSKSNIPQPGQMPKSRPESAGGPRLTPPPPVGHYTPHRNPSTSAHPLSHDITTPENQGYSPYPQPGGALHAEVDSNGNPAASSNGTNTPASGRQQLKPLQTNQPGAFPDPNVQAFYPPQAHPGSAAAAQSISPADHRQVPTSAELASPDGAVSLPPGAAPMVAPGVYQGLHTPGGIAGGVMGGIGASPVGASPVGVGGGVLLGGGGPGMIQTTYPPRRKAIRAAQACDACRARKAKCDEGRPSCGFCKESQVPCVYREVPPPKQDRTLLQILDRLGRVEGLLESINARDQTREQEQQSGRALDGPPEVQTTTTGVSGGVSNSTTIQNSQPANPPEILLDEDEQLTIPYQHTTAAHKLLWWPSIRTLIDEDLLTQETYVIDEEENRGVLRIYGRGEGSGSGDTPFEDDSDVEYMSFHADQWGNMQYRDVGAGQWDRAVGEDGGMVAVDTPATDQTMPADPVAATAPSGAPPPHGHEEPRGAGGVGGAPGLQNGTGPGEPGKLRFDRRTVLELLNSYLANIHILHPILDTATITHTVLRFADRFDAVQQDNQHANNSPAAPYPMTAAPQPGLGIGMGISNDSGPEMSSPRHRANSITGKRKRSQSQTASSRGSGPLGSGAPLPQGQPPLKRSIPRNIHSALVLLVLALGAVCLHRQPVPGPLPRSSPYASSGYPGSTPPYATNTTPPYSGSGAQAYPTGGARRRQLRNVDVIPGLAYFSQALDIMGGLIGSNELENVQAGLLAGLYWGQLARVLDSWKWISWACMGCQILIRMKLATEKDELRKDLILRAFWSCLQLESDVLAELDLPPSGISRLEDSMMLPGAISSPSPYRETKDDDPLMWMYYLAQIALRKLLNRVHTALYKQDKSHLDSPRSLAIARELDYQLEQWKKHLPEPLRWDESDPPSADINAARLRAKYFGARYIIHRPFVYHALHHSDNPTGASPTEPSPISPNDDDRAGLLEPNSLENNCRKCIDAALQSTTAFHAFDPDMNRPIITNVFGTAHAQFGNLLVLQAAYRSTALRRLISGHVLAELFAKTIHWFRTLAPISPPLRRDAVILENVAAKMEFVVPPQQY